MKVSTSSVQHSSLYGGACLLLTQIAPIVCATEGASSVEQDVVRPQRLSGRVETSRVLDGLLWEELRLASDGKSLPLVHQLLTHLPAHKYVVEESWKANKQTAGLHSRLPDVFRPKLSRSLRAVYYRHFERTTVEAAILSTLLRDLGTIERVCEEVAAEHKLAAEAVSRKENGQSTQSAGVTRSYDNSTDAFQRYKVFENFLAKLIEGYEILSASGFMAKSEFFQPLVLKFLAPISEESSAIGEESSVWHTRLALSEFLKKHRRTIDHLVKKYEGRSLTPSLVSGDKHVTRAKERLAKAHETLIYNNVPFWLPETHMTEPLAYGGMSLREVEAEHEYLCKVAARVAVGKPSITEPDLIAALQPTSENLTQIYEGVAAFGSVASLRLLLMQAVSGGSASVCLTKKRELSWSQYEVIRCLSALKPSVLVSVNEAAIQQSSPLMGPEMSRALMGMPEYYNALADARTHFRPNHAVNLNTWRISRNALRKTISSAASLNAKAGEVPVSAAGPSQPQARAAAALDSPSGSRQSLDERLNYAFNSQLRARWLESHAPKTNQRQSSTAESLGAPVSDGETDEEFVDAQAEDEVEYDNIYDVPHFLFF